MRLLKYGDSTNSKIILIHGAVIPWEMWKPQIDYFSKKYHVIVPALDGHDSDGNDFISVQKAAQDIESYYLETYGNEVFAVLGMSMGGTIAGVFWQNGVLHIRNLVLESAPLVKMNPLMIYINTRQNLSMVHKVQRREQKTIKTCKEIYSKDLLPYYIKMVDSISEQTIKNCVSSFGKFNLPSKLMTNDMNIIFFLGTTFMEIMAKKSAKYIQRNYPQIKIKQFQGYNHCELSVNHPEQYIQEIEQFLS